MKIPKGLSSVRGMVGLMALQSVNVAKTLGALLLLALLGYNAAKWSSLVPSQEALTADALPKVVEIRVMTEEGGFVGSGAFISADGMILSCAHLFSHEGTTRIQVKTDSGSVMEGFLVRLDTKHDLSLVKVFGNAPFPYFRLGGTVRRGQKITAFGSPLAIQKTVTVGYVGNLGLDDSRLTLHTAPISPGNSGGPLVSENGYLVGVNVAGLLQNIIIPAECLELAVNAEIIKAFLAN